MISEFRRFLHWGPIIALSIIKCITMTTFYMNLMWWPPNETLGGLLNQAIFLLFSSIATLSYVLATVIGPGVLPRNWTPKSSADKNQLQYCKICEGYKAPRSHHCRKCNRCIKKMDHHCPWINNCVGWANHAYFTYFLSFAIIGSFHAAIVLCCSFYRGVHRYWYLSNGYVHLATVQFTLTSVIMCIFSMGLAIGVVIALSMLLYFQLKSILTNQTGIESWITEKALYRRKYYTDMYPFVYPYDLGFIENLRQVFSTSCVRKGDGIHWPVIKQCDQYTLTREQIAQKAEKRARTKTYKCIRPATGSFLPLFSQGFRVCMSPPCTDESRIRLEPGDIIKVTRFRQHWLFGERVDDDSQKDSINNSSNRKKAHRVGPIRGWFPRRCALELIEPDAYSNCTESDDSPITTDYVDSITLTKRKSSKSSRISNGNGKHQNGFKIKNP